MAAEDVLLGSQDAAVDILQGIGSIGLWLQAIGVIVVLWILIQVINWVFNRKRLKALYSVKDDLQRLEKKVDKLVKKL